MRKKVLVSYSNRRNRTKQKSAQEMAKIEETREMVGAKNEVERTKANATQ